MLFWLPERSHVQHLSHIRGADEDNTVLSVTIKVLHKPEWCQLSPGKLYHVKQKDVMSGRTATSIIREVSQRKTDTVWYHLQVESKIWHKWTDLWNRNRLTDIENRFVVASGEGLVQERIGSFGLADVN